MKLFKDSENNVYAYEKDGSQDHLIGDKTPVTQAEANVLIKEQEQIYYQKWLSSLPSKEEQIAQLQAQLADLQK